MTDLETISVQHDGAVDYLTLNRPEALNSINSQMVTELRQYFSGLMENTDTRVVVMKGAGRAFCAGLDLMRLRPTEPQVRCTELSPSPPLCDDSQALGLQLRTNQQYGRKRTGRDH